MEPCMTVSTKKSRWGEPMRYSLNELEAFDAMRTFLEAFWRRGGCKSEELANLLSWTNRQEWPSGKQLPDLTGAPLDIAQWEDWLDAVAATKSD
jgi:hypothetical protein